MYKKKTTFKDLLLKYKKASLSQKMLCKHGEQEIIELQLFEEGAEEGHEVHVVAQATAFTGVSGAVIAAEGTAEGVDEDGRTMLAEKPVVAVGGIVAARYFGSIVVLAVQALQTVNIWLGLRSIGVDNHQTFVSPTKEVEINRKFYLGKIHQRMVGKVVRTDNTRLLATEEEEDVSV